MSDSEIVFTDENASPDLSDRFEAPIGTDDVDLDFTGAEDKKVLTMEEYNRLSSAQQNTDVLTQTLQGLQQNQAAMTSLLQQTEERKRAANAPKPPEEIDRDKLIAELDEKLLNTNEGAKAVFGTAEKIAKSIVEKERGPLVNVIEGMQRQLAAMQVGAATSDPSSKWVVEKYSNELNQILDQMPSHQKMDPQMVRNAVNYVKGLHADEYIADQLQNTAQQGGKKPVPVTRTAQPTYAAKGGASGAGERQVIRIPSGVTQEMLREEAAANFFGDTDEDVRRYAAYKYGKRS